MISIILHWYKNGKSTVMLYSMKKSDTNVNIPSYRKEIDHHDVKTHWPNVIKETIQWFTFHSIVEHTAGIIETDVSLLPSLLKFFAMFQMCLF